MHYSDLLRVPRHTGVFSVSNQMKSGGDERNDKIVQAIKVGIELYRSIAIGISLSCQIMGKSIKATLVSSILRHAEICILTSKDSGPGPNDFISLTLLPLNIATQR